MNAEVVHPVAKKFMLHSEMNEAFFVSTFCLLPSTLF